MLLDSLDKLFEQLFLELIKMAFVSSMERLSIGRETPQKFDLEILTSLFESFLDLALHVEDLLLHARVPVVLDGVVGAALQVLGNDGPLVFVHAILNVEDELLLETPIVLFDPWIQMVVPALTALLADTAWQVVGNVGPLLCSIALYQRQH